MAKEKKPKIPKALAKLGVTVPPKPKAKKAKTAKKEKAKKPKLLPPAKPEKFSAKFVADAKKLDTEINHDIQEATSLKIKLGAKFREFKSLAYHKAFGLSFGEWVKQKQEMFELKGKSSVYALMQVNKVVVEDGKVPEATVNKMSVDRALMVARMLKNDKTRKAVTEEVIKAATQNTDAVFEEQVFNPIMQHAGLLKNPDGTPARKKATHNVGPYRVTKGTKELWDEAFDIAKFHSKDDDDSLSLEEKTLRNMAIEIAETWRGEYDEAKAAEDQHDDNTAKRESAKA